MSSGPVPGIQIPSSQSGLTTFAANQLLEGHIFNAGFEMPDVLEALIIKYPDFYLTSLLNKIGATSEIENSTQSWNVMGRTRRGATLTTVTNNTTAVATAVLSTAYAAASGNLGYFLVSDTVRVAQSGAIGIVLTATNSGANQQVTLGKIDGSNWTAAEIASGMTIGHIGSSFGEGSASAGGYRNYFPESDWNVTTILRRDFKISRDAMTAKHWVNAPGGKKWWYAQEDFEQRELMRDVEATLLFGSRFKSASLGGPNLSRGLFEYAQGAGVQQTFSSASGVQEADISNLLRNLSDQQGGNELVALCGTQFLFDVQHALKDYRTIPTNPTPQMLAGLGFESYQIGGKTIHFAKYELFSDPTIVPAVQAGAVAKDFSNLALVLDFSQTENGTNVQIKYRKGAKMLQHLYPGMPGPGAITKFDGVEGALLTEFMPVVYLPNRLGLIYANS